MKVKFITRVFMPNQEWVLEAAGPRYEVEFTPFGWVKVTDIAAGKSIIFPPHQIEAVFLKHQPVTEEAPPAAQLHLPPDPPSAPPAPSAPEVEYVEPLKRPRGRPPKIR